MKRIFEYGVGLIMAATLAATLYATWISQPIYDAELTATELDTALETFEIAPKRLALTFARIVRDGAPILLLVDRVSSGQVLALDLTAIDGHTDPIDWLNANAKHRAQYGRWAAGRSKSLDSVAYEALILPLAIGPTTPIAAGTNYLEHAAEAALDGEPFLFPKFAAPTPWNAPVPAASLLDYEAELCAVTLTDHDRGSESRLGFLLCNDFTDRGALVQNLDFDAPMGTTGFAEGKGGAGRLPLGALFVVPWHVEAFHYHFELQLFVDGHTRQRDSAGLMVWAPSEIPDRALAACDLPYYNLGERVNLAPCDALRARTLLLTGTPKGVIFRPANVFAPWVYLARGARVTTTGTWLGYLDNVVQ